jgi:hypothetical protein
VDECCKHDSLQHVDRKAIAIARRGMEHINKNGVIEFFLHSLLSNEVMSEIHGGGLAPIVIKVKEMRYNVSIICTKAWYMIHKIPQRTFYNYQHYF